MLKNHEMAKFEISLLKILKHFDNFKTNDSENKKLEFEKNIYFHGDRFIPRRCLNINDINKKCLPVNNIDVLMWEPPVNYWLQNSIGDLLETVFCIKEKRILQFAEKYNEYKNHNKKDWSCKARRKPFAYTESIHDSIGFSDCFEGNKMDWSVNGQVVACFADDVIIWKHIRDISITFHVDSANCLAYCPKGRYLAIGCKITNFPVVELWDVNKYSVRIEVTWRYFFTSMTTKVECFEWSKCGKFLIAGTNKGNIYVLTVPHLKLMQKMESMESPINAIRFSPNMRFLASGDCAGNLLIYSWTNFKLIEYLHVCWKRETKIMLDWHPWHGGDKLAIAENKPSIVILNVVNKQITSYYRPKDRNIEINSLAFNKITAELCVSIARKGPNGYTETKVLVLGSLNRVVDVLTTDYGARFLMWDPNGTRLVTAGVDDSLTIWKFIPEIKKKFKSNSNRFNEKLQEKLFHGCEKGEKFKLWSNLR